MVEQADKTTDSLNEMKGVDQKHGQCKRLVQKRSKGKILNQGK